MISSWKQPFAAILPALLAAIVLIVAPVRAGAAEEDGVWEACEADIAKYCEDVEPGEGRILSCLYAHETVVSDQCDAAFADFGDAIDGFFFTVRSALATCAVDLEEHCSDVKFGKGRLLSCLGEAKADLEPACEALVTDLSDFLNAGSE